MATSESVIRRMTRLADRHQAINLAQGFTDEAPPFPMVWEAVATLLGGTDAGIDRVQRTTVGDLVSSTGADPAGVSLGEALATLCASHDQFSQYSFPFGLAELREAIADYTERWCGFRPSPESETTVVLGATEGLASVFAGLCAPGDGVIVFEPFHEMYPAQAAVFGLRPIYLTLREGDGQWRLDRDELVRAAAGARILVLNTPHNPTGKVFTRDELRFIAEVALGRDLLVITDEIYEQITYDGHRHVPIGFRARYARAHDRHQLHLEDG